MRPKAKRVLFILLHILLFPVAFLEYAVTFWFWAGDGRFTLLAVPIFALIFLAIQWLLFRKYKAKRPVRIALIYSMVFVTPLLAVGCTELLVALCGIPITLA